MDVAALWLFTIIYSFVSDALQGIYKLEADDGLSAKVEILYITWHFSLGLFANTFRLDTEDIKNKLEALFRFYRVNENLALHWSTVIMWSYSSAQHNKCCQSESHKERVHDFHFTWFFPPYFLIRSRFKYKIILKWASEF